MARKRQAEGLPGARLFYEVSVFSGIYFIVRIALYYGHLYRIIDLALVAGHLNRSDFELNFSACAQLF